MLDKYDYNKLQEIKNLQKELLDEQKKTNEILNNILNKLMLFDHTHKIW